MTDTPLRDVRYAARVLGVSVSGIYRLVASRQLAYVDINPGTATRHRAVLRFLDADLEAFITRQRVASEPVDERTRPQAVAARAVTPTLPLPAARRYG